MIKSIEEIKEFYKKLDVEIVGDSFYVWHTVNPDGSVFVSVSYPPDVNVPTQN